MGSGGAEHAPEEELRFRRKWGSLGYVLPLPVGDDPHVQLHAQHVEDGLKPTRTPATPISPLGYR
jgi:hypothetical protein